MKRRHQKVVVIQRIADEQFYCGAPGGSSPQWTPDLAEANFVAPSKVKGLIRAVWGAMRGTTVRSRWFRNWFWRVRNEAES